MVSSLSRQNKPRKPVQLTNYGFNDAKEVYDGYPTDAMRM